MRSIEDILESLELATEQGKLQWSKGHGSNTFKTTLPTKYSVWARTWFDEDNSIEGVTIDLRDQDSDVIDEVTADQFSPKYKTLSDFFGVARRSAYNVDEVLFDIEKQLHSLTKKS